MADANREIVFDTETTGIRTSEGHRLIEVGCVELVNMLPTGRVFHAYINPERDVPENATRVHGIRLADLIDKPPFRDPAICDRLLAFIGDSPLVAHNAAFDREHLNAEFARIGHPGIPAERWIDSLELARKRFPGAANNLDALCKRFRIDLSERTVHGALLDARLLAEVYLELRGGRTRMLELESEDAEGARARRTPLPPRPRPRPPLLSDAERAAHAAFVAEMGDKALWHKISGH
jgi:DNA polymerase-3 subunit epsilon